MVQSRINQLVGSGAPEVSSPIRFTCASSFYATSWGENRKNDLRDDRIRRMDAFISYFGIEKYYLVCGIYWGGGLLGWLYKVLFGF